MATGERTTIARLRLRAPPRSATAPARVAALLAGTELRPRGLAPGALLCVRRLEDPAPGTLALDPSSLRPPERWRERVVDSLDEALRRAARPALGAVPAAADSVLFADRAELLAALAREWCGGTALTCWWWPSIAEAAPPNRAVPRAWLESAEAVPAALELLAREQRAVAFARLLDEEQAVAITLALARRYGLRDVVAAFAKTSASERALSLDARSAVVSSPAPGPSEQAARLGEPPPRSPARRSARAPAWAAFVPEAVEQALDPAQRSLLALGLLLRRRPPLARAPLFGPALVRWAAAPQPATRAPRPETGEPEAVRPRRDADCPSGTREPGPAAAGTQVKQAPGRTPDPGRNPAQGAGTPLERAAARDSARPATLPPEPPEIEPERSATAPAAVSAAAATLEEPLPQPDEETIAVRTALGGLVMLVNVGIALELYGDFTSPLHPGIRLDPWHFVILAGRRLLGPPRSRAYRDDPLWALLSNLAGDRPLGAGFRPPSAWRLPPAWLEAFAQDERPWAASRGAGRLRVEHPAGFTVVDVPAGADTRRRLRRALARYGSPATVPGRPGRRNEPQPLDRWLDRLVSYLRARLRLALGADPADRLLPIPATVLCSAERIDVEISLSQLPVEIRLAGLDRDPGWFPAAGRHIAFHFA